MQPCHLSLVADTDLADSGALCTPTARRRAPTFSAACFPLRGHGEKRDDTVPGFSRLNCRILGKRMRCVYYTRWIRRGADFTMGNCCLQGKKEMCNGMMLERESWNRKNWGDNETIVYMVE